MTPLKYSWEQNQLQSTNSAGEQIQIMHDYTWKGQKYRTPISQQLSSTINIIYVAMVPDKVQNWALLGKKTSAEARAARSFAVIVSRSRQQTSKADAGM